jgi:hypothetical protein
MLLRVKSKIPYKGHVNPNSRKHRKTVQGGVGTHNSNEKIPENTHVMQRLMSVGCRFAVFENRKVRTMRGRRMVFPIRLK